MMHVLCWMYCTTAQIKALAGNLWCCQYTVHCYKERFFGRERYLTNLCVIKGLTYHWGNKDIKTDISLKVRAGKTDKKNTKDMECVERNKRKKVVIFIYIVQNSAILHSAGVPDNNSPSPSLTDEYIFFLFFPRELLLWWRERRMEKN